MTTPEEILRKSGNIFDAIEEAQKEAWNEAIEAAAENAYTNSIGKESILKLKK